MGPAKLRGLRPIVYAYADLSAGFLAGFEAELADEPQVNIEDMRWVRGGEVHEEVLAKGLCMIDFCTVQDGRLGGKPALRAGHAEWHPAGVSVECEG